MANIYKTLGEIDTLILDLKESKDCLRLKQIRTDVCDLILKCQGLQDFFDISMKDKPNELEKQLITKFMIDLLYLQTVTSSFNIFDKIEEVKTQWENVLSSGELKCQY